jgi:hypothetical protein
VIFVAKQTFAAGNALLPFVAGAWALFLFHQIGLAVWGKTWVVLDSFLDPTLAVPVMVGTPLLFIRSVFRKNFPLHPALVWGFAGILGVVFEAWIPSFDPRFTADPWDALAYGAGALLTNIAVGNVLPLQTQLNDHESTR